MEKTQKSQTAMYKRRLISVLFLKNGWMVRSEDFSIHQVIGDPLIHVERLVEWDVDELIILDITNDQSSFDHARSDYKHKPVDNLLAFINRIASECCIPLSFGGRIRSMDDISARILNGADKVCVNQALFDTPNLIGEAARRFGRQAIVASIDYRMVGDVPIVFSHAGKTNTGIPISEWAVKVVANGAGEILLNAADRDGRACGYDVDSIQSVVDSVPVPVVACGGAGHQRHFLECYEKTGASAVAAGNIFHFTENAYPRAKTFLKTKRVEIR